MPDVRPRTNAEILDAAFEIYRRHFWTFFAISFVVTLPSGTARYMLGQLSPTDRQSITIYLVTAWLIAGTVAPFAESAFVTTTSNAYLGKTVDIVDSIRSAFVRPFRLFALVWIRALMLALGAILVIIPGLVVYKRYFAVVAAFTIEELPVGAAMRRSRELSNGNGTRVFFVPGAVLVFSLVAGSMLGAFLAALGKGTTAAILYLLAIALFSPFGAIVMTLLYYDIRVRREGYDIELMAGALGTPTSSAASPDLRFSDSA